jgi:hypothetical protein
MCPPTYPICTKVSIVYWESEAHAKFEGQHRNFHVKQLLPNRKMYEVVGKVGGDRDDTFYRDMVQRKLKQKEVAYMY